MRAGSRRMRTVCMLSPVLAAAAPYACVPCAASALPLTTEMSVSMISTRPAACCTASGCTTNTHASAAGPALAPPLAVVLLSPAGSSMGLAPRQFGICKKQPRRPPSSHACMLGAATCSGWWVTRISMLPVHGGSHACRQACMCPMRATGMHASGPRPLPQVTPCHWCRC